MKIIIVGGGEKGLTLSNFLNKDHQVTLIELDDERAKLIATKTQSLILHGDGSDISILKQANVDEADYVVAMADDKTNLIVCQIAKNENVEKIIALVSESKNEELFSKLEISNMIFVVGTIVSAIQRTILQAGSQNIISQLGLGEQQLIKVEITEGSSIIDQTAKIKDVDILAIYREGKLIHNLKDETFKKHDTLLLVTRPKNLEKINNLIGTK